MTNTFQIIIERTLWMPRGLDFKETVLPQRAMPKTANPELEGFLKGFWKTRT